MNNLANNQDTGEAAASPHPLSKQQEQSLNAQPSQVAVEQNEKSKTISSGANLIDDVKASAELTEKSEARRQPLRLKFKGIIINKVLQQIYSKNHPLLHQFLKSLKINRPRGAPKRLTLDDLERRTMIVLVSTLVFSIEKSMRKVIQQTFDQIKEHS